MPGRQSGNDDVELRRLDPKGRRKRCGFRWFKKNGRSMKTDRPLVVPGLPGSSRAAVQP
jgi:hypothetical protein